MRWKNFTQFVFSLLTLMFSWLFFIVRFHGVSSSEANEEKSSKKKWREKVWFHLILSTSSEEASARVAKKKTEKIYFLFNLIYCRLLICFVVLWLVKIFSKTNTKFANFFSICERASLICIILKPRESAKRNAEILARFEKMKLWRHLKCVFFRFYCCFCSYNFSRSNHRIV